MSLKQNTPFWADIVAGFLCLERIKEASKFLSLITYV